MKNKIIQYIDKLSTNKQADNPHCDLSSPRIHMVKAPIPAELYQELATMSAEYHRDLQCLAGDFLTLALEEAIANIPKKEKDRLYLVRRQHELEEAEQHKELCQYSAGGT